MHLPVVVWRLLGEVISWLLGPSSPGFLGTHLPVIPDLSGPWLYLGMIGSVHRCIVLVTSDVGVHDYNNYYSSL